MQDSIDLTKDHLYKVNTIITIHSDSYGTYYMRCIANVNWFHESVSFEDFTKYHPKNWAGSYKISHGNADVSRYVGIFVALDEDNKDWFKNNKDSECARYLIANKKRNKTLPVTSSVKAVEKFLKIYKEALVEV
jgi:hypothetical protein